MPGPPASLLSLACRDSLVSLARMLVWGKLGHPRVI